MKTYWFTIADGPAYAAHAERLRLSLKRHGLALDILQPGPPNSQAAKQRKISGILAAPPDCERIVYLDADTLALDPGGIEAFSGAWRIPWRIPAEASLPRTLAPQPAGELLESFYRRHGLAEFARGGSLEGVEWNSGVIAGERGSMQRLAREWAVWWPRILDLFGGHFRRDQLSFRIAYARTCLAENPAGLPAEYNWVASYFGLNPNARILHRTMVRGAPWLDEEWERLAARLLGGESVAAPNRFFDGCGLSAGRPSLHRQLDLDPALEADLLRQTLAFSRPEQVLLCGAAAEDRRFLPLVRRQAAGCVCIPALDRLPPELDPGRFDLVLFCGVDYEIPAALAGRFKPAALFCFAGLHDMALYRRLYEFEVVRILVPGFGLFSHAAPIQAWAFTGGGDAR